MLYPPDLHSQLDQALYTLKKIVLEGLDHGYFEYSLRCKTENSNKRILTITAGISYRFSIPPEDLKH